MIDQFVQIAEASASAYGALGVFALAIFQEIFPPLPSTLVAMVSGFLFLGGAEISGAAFWNLFVGVALPLSAGLTIGAMVIYGVVYALGRPAVERWGKYAGVSWADLEKLQSYMRRHVTDEWGLFIARALPLVPSVALNVFFGLVRWRPWMFATLTFFGTIIRALITGFIGWQVGNLYLAYASAIDRFQNIMLIAVVLVVALYLSRKKFREKKELYL